MRILIMGASGFIGCHLIKTLLKGKVQIWAHSRHRQTSSHEQVTWFQDFQALEGVDAIDAVINLAGASIAKPWTKSYKKVLWSSRIDTTETMIDWLKTLKTSPKVLINASAVGYYGTDENIHFDESSPADPNSGFASRLCQTWERAAAKAQSIDGCRVVLMRFGVVLGRDGGMISRMWWPFKLGLGCRIGDGSQMMSWIHIDDAIAAIGFAINHRSIKGPLNVTSPFAVSQVTFADGLSQAFHRSRWMWLPSPLFKYTLGEMAEELLLSGATVLPKKLEASGFEFKHPHIESAFQEIVSPVRSQQVSK